MKCCSYDSRKFFLFGARIYFGAWLLYVGLSKWIFAGPTAFSGYISGQFANTWSPAALNTALAWVILIAEPLLALLILAGVRARKVWMATALLMFILLFGQTMLMKYDVVADNWQYLILALACAALHDEDVCAAA
jgi:uncharacterized membrane protein YphA (DoxX/SURF4 family)